MSIFQALARSPDKVAPDWLHRNQDLNPRDTYLPVAVREALESALKRHQGNLSMWRRETRERGDQEFAALIQSGALRAIDYHDYVRSLEGVRLEKHVEQVRLAVEARRREAVFEGLDAESTARLLASIQVLDDEVAHGFRPYLTHRIGNLHYACRQDDLPNTRLALQAHRATFLALAEELVRDLRAAGAIDDAEGTALIAAAGAAFAMFHDQTPRPVR